MTSYLRSAVLVLVLPAFMVISACSDDEAGNNDNFDRGQMMENISSNIILPAFEDFTASTADLKAAVTAFSSEQDQASLDVAQQAWLEAALSWSYAEMFMMGPVDQKVLSASINNWPTSIVGIEDAIDTDATINKDYIISLASTRKGLPAIEYLLFNFEEGDQAVMNNLHSDTRRVQYLVAMADRLHDMAMEINEAWKPTGENYYQSFAGSTGKDAASSINVLANEFLMLVEKVKNLKLGVPLGKKSMGVLIPENVEARFSGHSIALINRNLDAIEDVFTGDTENGPGLGYADYLDAFDAKYNDQLLSLAITGQIEKIRSDLDLLTVPLKTAIENEYAIVEEAYTSSQKLVVLTKADMMSNLGLLVTYTDNDGD